MKTKHHGQMSESFLTAVFLSLSGGLQDAYTYLFRGKVFANAQTGNIVLLSTNIMDGRWDKVLHYLVPLCAFARVESATMLSPNSSASPLVGVVSPVSILIVVVLPAPFTPSSAKSSPSNTERFSSWTAVFAPYCLVS